MSPPAVPMYHLVLHHHGRHGDGVLRGGIGHDGIPQQLAALRIDGQQVRIHGAHEQGVAEDGKTRD